MEAFFVLLLMLFYKVTLCGSLARVWNARHGEEVILVNNQYPIAPPSGLDVSDAPI